MGLIERVGGVPNFFLLMEFLYFCELGAHAKFQNPTGVLVMACVPGSYVLVPGGYIPVPGGYIPVPGGYIQVPRGYIQVPGGYIRFKR